MDSIQGVGWDAYKIEALMTLRETSSLVLSATVQAAYSDNLTFVRPKTGLHSVFLKLERTHQVKSFSKLQIS